MNNNLAKAIGARDKFLKENPHMEKFQSEIDIKVAHLDSPSDRLTVLCSMIQENLLKLQGALEFSKVLIENDDS